MNSPFDNDRESWINGQPDHNAAIRELSAGSSDLSNTMDIYELANNVLPPDFDDFMAEIERDEEARRNPDWIQEVYLYFSGNKDTPPVKNNQ